MPKKEIIMNYVKKSVCVVIMMLALLSSSNSFAIEWGSYVPDWSTWNRARDTASSYIPPIRGTWENAQAYFRPAWEGIRSSIPSWQSVKDTALAYSIPTGITSLGSHIYSTSMSKLRGAGPSVTWSPTEENYYNKALFGGQLPTTFGAMLAPVAQFKSRMAIPQAQRPNKFRYAGTVAGSTLASIAPVLINAYREGRIDTMTFNRLMNNPNVRNAFTTSALTATGLATLEFIKDFIERQQREQENQRILQQASQIPEPEEEEIPLQFREY